MALCDAFTAPTPLPYGRIGDPTFARTNIMTACRGIFPPRTDCGEAHGQADACVQINRSVRRGGAGAELHAGGVRTPSHGAGGKPSHQKPGAGARWAAVPKEAPCAGAHGSR